ncbi:MAG TPA: hypothetical protein VH085_06695 [Nocardioides sp.]|jgi:hypothetical protein|nr:hypothetical protein [Nocardioides sp.]
MSHSRTTYDEIDSPGRMRVDAAAAGRALRLEPRDGLEPAGSSREGGKRDITVHEAAARIARALGLYLE